MVPRQMTPWSHLAAVGDNGSTRNQFVDSFDQIRHRNLPWTSLQEQLLRKTKRVRCKTRQNKSCQFLFPLTFYCKWLIIYDTESSIIRFTREDIFILASMKILAKIWCASRPTCFVYYCLGKQQNWLFAQKSHFKTDWNQHATYIYICE